jgi:hypothetical protein
MISSINYNGDSKKSEIIVIDFDADIYQGKEAGENSIYYRFRKLNFHYNVYLSESDEKMSVALVPSAYNKWTSYDTMTEEKDDDIDFDMLLATSLTLSFATQKGEPSKEWKALTSSLVEMSFDGKKEYTATEKDLTTYMQNSSSLPVGKTDDDDSVNAEVTINIAKADAPSLVLSGSYHVDDDNKALNTSYEANGVVLVQTKYENIDNVKIAKPDVANAIKLKDALFNMGKPYERERNNEEYDK